MAYQRFGRTPLCRIPHSLPIHSRQRECIAARTQSITAGFTIVELMIALAIAAILLMMAVPSYQGFIKRSNVQNLQTRMATAIVTARSEATARNGATTLCASADGATCGGVWNNGWIVFLDNGAGGGTPLNASRETTEALLLSYKNTGNYSIDLQDETSGTTLANFSFNSQGFSLNQKRAVVTVCEPGGDLIFARGLIIERSGRTLQTRDLEGDNGIQESRFDDGFGNITVNDLSC
ncbi:MAG: GspH/FimT family protein [Marinagarivorans sp.]|nr:GspH/FimT family protein [Marinagarivorans sp.]